MLASTASAPRVTRCSLGLYWSRDLCTAGWLGDVILSRSDSERQRNLMTHDQCPLPVYFSQIYTRLRLGQLEGKFGVPAREYLAARDFGGNFTYESRSTCLSIVTYFLR